MFYFYESRARHLYLCMSVSERVLEENTIKTGNDKYNN